jgi:hypothetical protein
VLALGICANLLVPAIRPTATAESSIPSYEEYFTPTTIEVDPSSSVGDVTLWDVQADVAVPLSGKGIVHTEGRAYAKLPQLPVGIFSLTHPGGVEFFSVYDSLKQSPSDAREGGSGGGRLLLLGGLLGIGLAVIVFRKNKAALLLALVAIGSGVVLVTVLRVDGADASLEARWRGCEALIGDDRIACKVDSMVESVQRGAIEDVARFITTSSDPQCHEAAHESSYTAWRTSRDLDRIYQLLLPGCDDGLIHGIAEAMGTYSTDENFPEMLSVFCDRVETSFARTACFHGGGHAAIWRTNGDLYSAWEICEKFSTTRDGIPNLVQECQGSAVMEWALRWKRENRKPEGERILQPVTAQPSEICLRGPADAYFKSGCYLGTNHLTGGAEEAANWCVEREKEFETACMSALGENLPYFETPLVSIELTEERAVGHMSRCGVGSAEATEACIRAASRVFTVMTLSRDRGMAVCGMLGQELGTTERSYCLLGLEDADKHLQARGLSS